VTFVILSKTMTVATAVAIFTIGMTTVAWGGAKPPVNDQAKRDHIAAARTVMQDEHVAEHLEGWGSQLRVSLDLSACGCLPADRVQPLKDAWSAAVQAAYKPDSVKARIEAALVDSMSVRELQQLTAFHRTPLGIKALGAERPKAMNPVAADAAAMARAQKDVANAEKALAADPARKSAIAGIVTLAGGEKRAAASMLSISMAVSIGAMAAMPEGSPRMDIEELKTQIEGLREKIEAMMRPLMVGSYAMIYKDLTTAELTGYHAQMRSPTTQKFIAVYQQTIDKAMWDQSLAIGTAFTKELKSTKL
jgi:hypothetical protein